MKRHADVSDARAGLDALQAALPEGIVDAHHHLWDLAAGVYPWLQDGYLGDRFFLGPYRSICRDYDTAGLRRDTAPLHLAASVHVEAERDRAEQVEETAWLSDVHRRTGLPSVVVAHLSFLQADRDAVLRAHAANPLVRGIRSKPVTASSPGVRVQGQPGTLQDDHWLAGLAKLEAHGLSWDLRVPYWHLAEAASVAAAFPRIQIILNHCGLPTDRSAPALAQWRDGMEALAAHPNVCVKLSEFGLPGGLWDGAGTIGVVRDTAAMFGHDRLLYGSNLPVSSLSAGTTTIVSAIVAGLGTDQDVLRRVFSGNARRAYQIPETSQDQ